MRVEQYLSMENMFCVYVCACMKSLMHISTFVVRPTWTKTLDLFEHFMVGVCACVHYNVFRTYVFKMQSCFQAMRKLERLLITSFQSCWILWFPCPVCPKLHLFSIFKRPNISFGSKLLLDMFDSMVCEQIWFLFICLHNYPFEPLVSHRKSA